MRRKRNRRQDDGLWEEDGEFLQEDAYPEEDPEEYAEDYTDSEAMYDDSSASFAAPPDDPYGDEYYDDEDYAEEKPPRPEPRSIFRPDVRKPNFVISVLVNTVRTLLLIVLIAGVAGLGALVGIAKGYVDTAPELDLVALDTPDQNTEFMDRNRNLLTVYRGTENRIVVPLAAIPQRLRNAFVAVEDARFYSHSGVDLKRIVGAFVANLTTSGTQGGSTITQQLIKNTLLSPEQSYKRKIQEARTRFWRAT